MKVKFKLTLNEFSELVNVIGQLPYKEMHVTEYEFINLKEFFVWGLNKVNSMKLRNAKMKQVSIDVNQWWAIHAVINGFFEKVGAYCISIVDLMEIEARPQIGTAMFKHLNWLS